MLFVAFVVASSRRRGRRAGQVEGKGQHRGRYPDQASGLDLNRHYCPKSFDPLRRQLWGCWSMIRSSLRWGMLCSLQMLRLVSLMTM